VARALRDTLGALPAPAPPDPFSVERTRRSARAALAESRRIDASPIAPLRRAFTHTLMPAVVTAASCSYLYWAFATVADIYR
jgi:hypothetical protein